MSRVPLLPILAGGYVAGVVGGAIVGGSWLLTLMLGLLLAAFVLARGGPRALLVAAVLAGGLAVFGHWRIDEVDARPPPLLASMSGEHEVVGTVRDDAVPDGALQRLDLDVESVDGRPLDGGVRITARTVEGIARAGDRLRLVLNLAPPPELEAFDYRSYLRDRDIYLVGSFPKEWEHLGVADRGWRGVLEGLHDTVVRRIGRALPEPQAALAAGVLVGERSAMPDDVDDALRATGTTHLVVVSGQNVALLLSIVVAILTVFVSRRAASVIALVLLPAYITFVGADPPVVRAGVMSVAVVAAGVTGRRTPGWIYLVYAVGLMLALDPVLVRDVAFQLSATATAGITILAPTLRDAALARFPALTTPGRAALVSMTASATGAALGVLPVQVAAFEVVAPWTVLANILVAPLYEATVATAAFAALLGGSFLGGEVAGDALAIVPGAFIWLVQLLAKLPGAQVPLSVPLIAGMAFTIVLAAVAMAASTYARRNVPEAVLDGGLGGGAAATTGLAVVAAGLWWGVLAPVDDGPSVSVLDVGQGLAVLVRHGDASLLIDTGPPDGAVLAALGRAGVSKVDAVVLTHGDLDHTGGLPALRDRLDVDQVYAGAGSVPDLAGAETLDIGDHLDVGAIAIDVLGPPIATRTPVLSSDNDTSLVLMITMSGERILVPGDIERAAEAWLISSSLDLDADVLVVPHHGSQTSSTAAFLAAVDPEVAVIPVGPNTYGHPHEDVLARYDVAGIEVYRTDEDGTVTIRGGSPELRVTTQR